MLAKSAIFNSLNEKSPQQIEHSFWYYMANYSKLDCLWFTFPASVFNDRELYPLLIQAKFQSMFDDKWKRDDPGVTSYEIIGLSEKDILRLIIQRDGNMHPEENIVICEEKFGLTRTAEVFVVTDCNVLSEFLVGFGYKRPMDPFNPVKKGKKSLAYTRDYNFTIPDALLDKLYNMSIIERLICIDRAARV